MRSSEATESIRAAQRSIAFVASPVEIAGRRRVRVAWAIERLREWSDAGGNGYGAGSSRTGHGDPTLAAVAQRNPRAGLWVVDQADAELMEASGRIRRLAEDAAWLERWAARCTQTAPSAPLPAGVRCENPRCDEPISGEGSDRPRDGLCRRCYRHQRRFGVAWPARTVAGRSTA